MIRLHGLGSSRAYEALGHQPRVSEFGCCTEGGLDIDHDLEGVAHSGTVQRGT